MGTSGGAGMGTPGGGGCETVSTKGDSSFGAITVRVEEEGISSSSGSSVNNEHSI